MSKRIWSIALAYVGVMIGAGVSSGQDLLQYFVSFGAWGLIGVIVLGVLHVGFGRLMIALGSYYRSDDHSVVLAEISHPVIYRILALQEPFETLMSPEFYKEQPCQKAWFAFDIQLFSRKELEGINVRARLEEIYGTDIVEITFSRLGDVREESLTVDQHLKDLEMQSPQEIVSDFYQTVTGGDVLSERQTALVESIFEEIGRSRQ